jgi:acetyl-CoA carboxylase beta subunit
MKSLRWKKVCWNCSKKGDRVYRKSMGSKLAFCWTCRTTVEYEAEERVDTSTRHYRKKKA